MPVKRTIPYPLGTFFITFTCYKWMHLIHKTNAYNVVYNWFNYLKANGHYINGYVIMPNHVHALISFADSGQSINTIIGNGKRFMAYEIIKRLKQQREDELLITLSNEVEEKRKQKNKQHEVWELSFDWKHCTSHEFINPKLAYIHNNPCVKKWQLCNNPIEYVHSSAKYYIQGEQSVYEVKHFTEMDDVDLLNGGSFSNLTQRP